MAHPYWPLFDLEIHTPQLTLRLPSDDEIAELLEASRAGVHSRDLLPFNVDWANPDLPNFEADFAKFHWLQRATWTTSEWNLVFAVFLDGAPIGLQSIGSKDFQQLRKVDTGSWLTLPQQGKGLGTEMRSAVLHFAFETLGATEAHSESREGNEQSIGVSRKLGYEPNGTFPAMMSEQAAVALALRLTRDRWEQHRPDTAALPITVERFEPARSCFFDPPTD